MEIYVEYDSNHHQAILKHLLVLFFRTIWFAYFVGSGAGFWFRGFAKNKNKKYNTKIILHGCTKGFNNNFKLDSCCLSERKSQ